MTRRGMIGSGLLMTAVALLMRTVGVLFSAYTARQLGESGSGLLALVMSVYTLAVTFAVSGIRFAATRLVSEELGLENPGGVSAAMWRCLFYGLLFFNVVARLIADVPLLVRTHDFEDISSFPVREFGYIMYHNSIVLNCSEIDSFECYHIVRLVQPVPQSSPVGPA